MSTRSQVRFHPWAPPFGKCEGSCKPPAMSRLSSGTPDDSADGPKSDTRGVSSRHSTWELLFRVPTVQYLSSTKCGWYSTLESPTVGESSGLTHPWFATHMLMDALSDSPSLRRFYFFVYCIALFLCATALQGIKLWIFGCNTMKAYDNSFLTSYYDLNFDDRKWV